MITSTVIIVIELARLDRPCLGRLPWPEVLPGGPVPSDGRHREPRHTTSSSVTAGWI
jgi:hypothetical protein